MAEAKHPSEQLEQVGRYLVLERLEDGESKGPVMAYDTHLDRRVLLHRLEAGERAQLEHALERARRWSGVSCPHLVAVHDSFEAGASCFVTVEHVQGQPLAEWLTAKQRSWPQIQHAARGVARALEALHLAGIVHGRVCTESVVVDGAGHGHLAGFAPEPIEAEPADRASDVRALAMLVMSAATEAGCRAPRFVADAAARAADDSLPPAAALAGLARAFERDPARTRRRTAAAAVLVLALGGIALGQAKLGRSLDLACTGADQLASEVWNGDRRASIESAFHAANAPFAEHAADRALAALDARSARWADMHTRACEATQLDRTQSEEVLDRRMQCLDERREELDALAQVLESADRDTIVHAIDMVERLTPIAACEAAAISTDRAPPEIRGKVDALRTRLARVGTLRVADRYAQGLEEVESIAREAADLDYPPLVAETSLMHGRLLRGSGEPLQAVPMLEKAVRQAWIAGQPKDAMEAWVSLERVLGETLQRERESDEVWGHGLAAWERAGRGDQARADLLAARAVVMFARGKYRESAALNRQAISLRKRILPADHFDVVSSLHNLANALYMAGEGEDALATYEEVLAIWEKALGPSHPSVANVHNNMGAVYLSRGDRTRAREELQKTLEIRKAALGPDHPDVASVLENLGVVAYELGELDEAMERLQEVLAIRRKKLGEDSPSLGGPLLNIGNVLHARGDYAAARESYERAREIFVRGLGPDHPNVGIALSNIGRTLRAEGKPNQAVTYLEQALALRERALGPDHPAVGSTLGQLGQAQIEAGSPAQGRRTLERAAALWEKKLPARGDDDVASARMALARILVAAPEGRERALALARLAMEGYREASIPHEAEAAAALRFLRRHGG